MTSAAEPSDPQRSSQDGSGQDGSGGDGSTGGGVAGRGPVLCVAAVWQMGDALVLVRSGTGPGAALWQLPGGAVRPGESLAEAVVRTISDDTGAEALCGPFLGWIEAADADVHTLTMCFEAVVLDPPGPDTTGTMPTGTATSEVRLTPTWEVTEVRLGSGLAEFLADHDLIELVI